MFKRVTVLVAFALGACAPAEEPTTTEGVQAMRGALPKAEEMSLRMPSAMALAPDQATFYEFTRGVTVGVNSLVRNISNIIEDVTEHPPTQTDGETFAVWGPYTAPLSPATWRVRVEALGEGHFEYVVEGWPKDEGPDAAQTVLSGEHAEVGGDSSGVWTYDMTTAHALAPIAHSAIGAIGVSYELAEERTLEVRFDDVQGRRDPMTTSTLYRYFEDAERAGSLDFISNLDIHQDDDPALDRRELLQVRSRWTATGEGQADVLATHGDLPQGMSAEITECWSDAFSRTFMSMAYGDVDNSEGDAALCPYDDVQRPVFEGFDADAFADGDLVAALPRPADLDIDPAAVADPAAELATYFVFARDTVAGLTEHVGGVIHMVRDITRHPPSDCTPDACTWGPYTNWEEGTTFLLMVRREGEGVFAFALRGKRFGAPEDAWRDAIAGGYERAEGEDGRGWFDYDLNVVADLDEDADARGAFRAEFARMGDHGQLAVRVDGVTTVESPEPTDARYFVDVTDEGGLLEVGFD